MGISDFEKSQSDKFKGVARELGLGGNLGAPDRDTQVGKFNQAARDLECDDRSQALPRRVAKLVKEKPVEKGE